MHDPDTNPLSIPPLRRVLGLGIPCHTSPTECC
jgi:hypothetical protein